MGVLIVESEGNRVMRFIGSRFPLNPSLAPAATAAQLKTAEMLTMLLNPDGYIPCRKNEPGVLQNYFGFVNNRYEIRMTLLFKGTPNGPETRTQGFGDVG